MARMPLREEGLCGSFKSPSPVAQTPSVKAPPLHSFIVHKTRPVSIHPDFMEREQAPAEPARWGRGLLLSPDRASKGGRNGAGPWEGIQKGILGGGALGAGGGGIGQGFQLNCKKSRGKGGTPKKPRAPHGGLPAFFITCSRCPGADLENVLTTECERANE